jgi:amidohydrolase
VREVLESSARAQRCKPEFTLKPGYPAVVNDHDATARAREIAREVVGEDAVIETPPVAAAEDFAYFLEAVPGVFILLGAGNEERGITAPHHSPEFDIDESVLPRGAELLARLALGGR